MRTSQEMMALFKRLARADERIRVLTLEGSRVNPHAAPDVWQDYDVTFLVTDVGSFTRSEEWLDVFGDRIFLQKPEAMELFPPDFPSGWFSYLMLFSDGGKIDLTLIPIEDLQTYLDREPLVQILLDKDGRCPALPAPSDRHFGLQKPSAAFVRDSVNEFVLACTHVAKGLLREQLLCANWFFQQIVQVELRRMLGYLAGARTGFPVNLGKHDKWLPRFLTSGEWERLRKTYRLDSVDAAWSALDGAMELFESALAEVASALGCDCPDDLERGREYLKALWGMGGPAGRGGHPTLFE